MEPLSGVLQIGIWRGCPRRQCVLGAVRFVPSHPLGIVSVEQFDKLEFDY